MHARTIALAIASLGWLVASLVAFVLVAEFTFFGIGLIGLLVWFICTRIELEYDSAVGSGWTWQLIASQHEARQNMSRSERAGLQAERTVAMQSIHFFRHLGMALTALGVVGFLWLQT